MKSSQFIGLSLLVALAFLLPLAVVNATKNDPTPKLTLSERINSACPKGYEVTNWETDGEFTEIPKDTIKVTCNAVNLDRLPQVIYRSVNYDPSSH